MTTAGRPRSNLVAVCVACTLHFISSPPRLASSTEHTVRRRVVRAERNGFLIDGQLLKAKGIVYAPFPIGATGAYDYTADHLARARDFPLLQQLGQGLVLRVVAAVTDRTFLDAAAVNGFWVIVGYPVDPALDFRDVLVREALKSNFRTHVRTLRGHTAILAYEIGNEVAFQIDLDPQNLIPDDQVDARKFSWFQVLAEMARIVREEEGADGPLVTSAFADLFSLGVPGVSDASQLASLDFLSCNVYRGTSIRRFVDELRAGRVGRVGLSTPVLISEMGVDAFDSNTHAEDEPTQRDFTATVVAG